MQQLGHRRRKLGTATAFSGAQAAAKRKVPGEPRVDLLFGDTNDPTTPPIDTALKCKRVQGTSIPAPSTLHDERRSANKSDSTPRPAAEEY